MFVDAFGKKFILLSTLAFLGSLITSQYYGTAEIDKENEFEYTDFGNKKV